MEFTFESGQTPTFTWEKIASRHYRCLSGLHEVWLEGGVLKSSPSFSGKLRRFFRLQDDVPAVYSALSEDDAVMAEAVRSFSGLRLTESGPWESAVCFIVSQNNHIPRIKRIVRGLHGPAGLMTPLELARADLKPLRAGYREPFLKATARMVAENGFSFERLRRRRLEAVRESLCELPGVGPKVADCIALYGLGRTDAFPADVWVKKAMARWYGLEKESRVQDFVETQWGRRAGYAQQLLFCQARARL